MTMTGNDLFFLNPEALTFIFFKIYQNAQNDCQNIAIKCYQSSTYENAPKICSEIICFQSQKVVALQQQSKESFSCTGSQA